MSIGILFATLLAGIFVPWYLIEAALFAHRLQRDFPTQWETLGRPAAFAASQQGALLLIILGQTKLPDSTGGSLRARLNRARFAGVIGAVAVLFMFGYSWAGGTS